MGVGEEQCGGGAGTTSNVMRYLAENIIDRKQYKVIREALSKRWERLSSLSAAVKLMESYGKKIDPAKLDRICQLEEGRRVQALVDMMPVQTPEEFQHFFLQMQLIVSTAAHVRQALQAPDPKEAMQKALEDAEGSGAAQYVLRMAIVVAGSEVKTIDAEYKQWTKDIDLKMAKVMRGQEDARSSQKKLASVRAQLNTYQSNQNDKSKRVLMNFVNNTENGILTSSFNGWKTFCTQVAAEQRVHEEYQEKIEIAQKRLLDYKTANLKGVRGMMKKKGEDLETVLVQEVFRAWKVDIYEEKKALEKDSSLSTLKAKLADAQKGQAENSKRVMMRMNGESDSALESFCFQAWITFHKEYQKNRAQEEEVKAAEAKVRTFLKKSGNNSSKVLQAAAGSTDAGLLSQVMTAWVTYYEEGKKEAAMCDILNNTTNKFGNITGRNEATGGSALDRQAYQLDLLVIIRCLGAWRCETLTAGTLRMYQRKMEKKKAQWSGVQKMFKDFGEELERGISGSVSSRSNTDMWDRPKYPKASGRGMVKGTKGTVSLPDINQKQATPLGSQRVTPGGSRSGSQRAAY